MIPRAFQPFPSSTGWQAAVRVSRTPPSAFHTIGSVPQTLPNPPAQVTAVCFMSPAHKARAAGAVPSPACRFKAGSFGIPAPLRLWHLASLDAPTVAVAWALGFAWTVAFALPLWLPVLLALVAFSVYVADRLLDARAALRTGRLYHLRLRHTFHWRHRRLLIPLAAAAACVSVWMVLVFMPVGALPRNSALAAAALAYFSGVHAERKLPQALASFLSPFLSKELLVGLLFTAACALPALSRAAAAPALSLWPLCAAAAFFAALAWLNCHSIERWESLAPPPAEATLAEPEGACLCPDYSPTASGLHLLKGAVLKGTGFSTCIDPAKSTGASAPEEHFPNPPSPLRPFLAPSLLAFSGLLLSSLLASTQPRPAALIAAGAASALLLALLDRLRHRLTPLALRAAADLVLLTPLVLLLK